MRKNILYIKKNELLDLYLKEIGKIKKYTAKEINNLTGIVYHSRQKLLQLTKKYKTIPDPILIVNDNKIPVDKKDEILMLIHNKEKAKQELIKANLKLVVKIAESYKTDGLSLLDLISEGNIGLIEGIERYDINRGTKISTYVSWWIKQKINLAILNQTHTIRLPKYLYKIIRRCKKISEELTNSIGHPPTMEEIAEKVSIPISKLIEIFQYTRQPVSLETKVKNKEMELKEIIEDSKSLTPFEVVYYMSFVEKVESLISRLKVKEQMVLKMKFGLSGMREYSLSEIGRSLGVSRERARQILQTGLSTLKSEIQFQKEDLFRF
ncbi:MAG: sigma-70 family RNA polymerase sigma factor [Spirochaetes bacterium]|nr:sigma-70 family RNA polymerase sigma factor [Spirochaetota bacterium]